jgi:glutaredoxin
MRTVQIYSRHGCHLCEIAVNVLESMQNELNFEIQEIFIDGNADLESRYGDQVPVIQIDHVQHDFFAVDPVRFRKAITTAN